jgi:hypothetical protein
MIAIAASKSMVKTAKNKHLGKPAEHLMAITAIRFIIARA